MTKPQNGKRWVAGCVTVWGRIIISQDLEKLEEFGELLVCNCANYTVIKAEVVEGT